jgi:putative transcriptional regulator|tara:strand:+ start:100503 stop:101141 length:639 start_codon:yes stop_codon:yes gene_type:complete
MPDNDTINITEKASTTAPDTSKVVKGGSSYLAGKLLVAMPNIDDDSFKNATIFMCAHDEKGAMGLIVNDKMPNIDFEQLLLKLKIEHGDHKSIKIPVLRGGPLDSSRGFVLHSKDFNRKDTINVDERFSVTGTMDALKAIADGSGPNEAIFMLGYSSWDAGQLEEELRDNSWIIVDADKDIIFNTTPDKVWRKAMSKIGVNPDMISNVTGNA